MKNFEFEHEGKKYWYSRSVAVLSIVIGGDKYGNTYVLANKRGKNTPDYQGKWCMPCGYLDFNETVEEATVRETYEETGVKLDIKRLSLMGINSIPEEKQNVTVRFMSSIGDINKYTLTSKNSELGEVDDIKWINVMEIDKYEWAFNHDELIQKYVFYK